MPLNILPLFACSRRYGCLLFYTAYHTFAVPITDFSADTIIHYITLSPIVVSICSVPLHIADTLRPLTVSGKLFNQFFILLFNAEVSERKSNECSTCYLFPTLQRYEIFFTYAL